MYAADDTVIFTPGKSKAELETKVNTVLHSHCRLDGVKLINVEYEKKEKLSACCLGQVKGRKIKPWK